LPSNCFLFPNPSSLYLEKEPLMNVMTTDPDAVQVASNAPAHLRRLVLTGFMGAGKSTVGRLLAERLGWEFLDLDALIESRTGLAVPAIFATHGEPHFRQLESQALASALGRSNLVLALGGGTPEVLTNRLLLEQSPATAIIFLDAPFPVLYDRCMLQTISSGEPAGSADPSQSRPVLADPATAEARFLVRRPIYRRLAQHTLDTASLTTYETVSSLLQQLNTPSRRRP
jgi:shikimate kinase